MRRRPYPSWVLMCFVVLLCSISPAASGVHLWRIEEIFSNADGTVQFIEMATCCGSTGGEVFLSGQVLGSNSHAFTFPANLDMTTPNKHLLLATNGIAALPDAPAPDGTTLQVSYDATSCANAANHHILFGRRSGLPAAPGGAFTLLGGVCGIGNATPYNWTGVPQPTDGANLIWFLVVATDAHGVEGSWGVDGRDYGGPRPPARFGTSRGGSRSIRRSRSHPAHVSHLGGISTAARRIV